MNDTACFLHTREVSWDLKTTSPLQRIRAKPTVFLADKKESAVVKEFPPPSPPEAGSSVPAKFHMGCAGTGTKAWRLYMFDCCLPQLCHWRQWIHVSRLCFRLTTVQILFLQVRFRRIQKKPQVCQIFPEEYPCWITVDPYAQLHTLLTVSHLC